MKIDFVILWVDGSDPAWIEEKNKYSPQRVNYGSGENRFRDFDNLQYWFRGVEKYAPWVNNIYFITWGHLPKWISIDNPKLKIVNHVDFIPDKYLPTFNSNCIELNLHRIEDLSECFVLFNDDTFLINNVNKEDFFVDELPCDEMVEQPIPVSSKKYKIAHTHVNNMQIINEHFDKREMIKKHFSKIINKKYGGQVLKSLFFLPNRYYIGFRAHHLAQAHLKSTFNEIWNKETEALEITCQNRFRGYEDVNHWLMRSWNMCNNAFHPRKAGFGKYFTMSDNNKEILDYIIHQKGKTICINDSMLTGEDDIDFYRVKEELKKAFETILPTKSSFEK